MKNLIKNILWLATRFEIIERWGLWASRAYAKAMFLKIYNLPGIVQYKSLGGLKLLREVCDILDSLGLVNFVAGGFAYDIAAGKITRYHKDSDVTVLYDGDTARIIEGFTRHGFQVIEEKSMCRLNKHGHSIDVYFNHPSDDGYVVVRYKDKLLRMPNCCFSYDTKYLFGNAYRIASDEYNICIEPCVEEKDSIEYISRLKRNSPITYRRSVEKTVETITVYEFHCEREGKHPAPHRADVIRCA